MTGDLNFAGKNIFITGGSRGIGRACARLFANYGARVAFTYHSNEEAAAKTMESLESRDKHLRLMADMDDIASVKKAFEAAVKAFGQIDILVNNAGIFLPNTVDDDFDNWSHTWRHTMAVNLDGAAHLCFLAATHMKQRSSGCIINITSRGAFRGEPNHLAYGASKAALNSLSQSLAVALAPYQIKVLALAPGFVDTDMAAEYLHGEQGENIKKQNPLGRVATADEVARAIVMLATDGLDFMTGGIVDFNGASYLRS